MKFGSKIIVADGFYKGIIGFLIGFSYKNEGSFYKVHPIKQLINNIPLDDFWIKVEEIALLKK